MRYSTTLILAALVLAAAVLIYSFKDKLTGEAKPPEKPAETKAIIKDLKMDDLVTATLEEAGPGGKPKTKFAFKQADKHWRLTEPIAAAADDYEVGRLLRAAVEGKYRQTVEPGKAGQPTLETLGLAPAAYRLVLTTDAKGTAAARTVIVAIGRQSALGEGVYVRVDDAPKAFVLERLDLLERAREKVNAYRSREVVDLGQQDLARLDIAPEKGPAIQLDRSEKERTEWVLAKPIAARADPEAAGKIVRASTGLSARDFVDDDPKDLARYGLDKPRLAITLWKRGEARPPAKPEEKAPLPEPVKAATLRFGGWADPKQDTVYLLTSDGKHVVAVDASNFKDLNRPVAEIRDKHVLAFDPARVSKVTVRIPAALAEKKAEVAYELARTGGKWTLQVAGRPEAKADPMAVEGLLKELGDTKVLYFAEGEQADLAKKFTPAGSVRIQSEGDSTTQGIDIGGPGEPPSLVKNIREDWVGRINDKILSALKKDSLAYLDRQVFAVDPKKVTRLAIQTPDRKVVLEKKGDKWALLEPAGAEPQPNVVPDLLAELENFQCERFLAATKDLKPYNLDTGDVVLTVTEEGEKKDAKPVEKVLRLARYEKTKVAGRAGDSDLVFEVAGRTFDSVAGEPVDRAMIDLAQADINRVEIAAGGKKFYLVNSDNRWYRANAAGTPGEEVQGEAVRDLVSVAAGLKADRWAAYEAKDLARFGLDKPAIRVKFTTDRATATLLVSDKDVAPGIAAIVDQRPIRYAMVEDGQRIAVLAGKIVDTLLNAAKAFEPKPEEKKPGEAKPAEKKDEAKPAEPKPAEPKPAEKK